MRLDYCDDPWDEAAWRAEMLAIRQRYVDAQRDALQRQFGFSIPRIVLTPTTVSDASGREK